MARKYLVVDSDGQPLIDKAGNPFMTVDEKDAYTRAGEAAKTTPGKSFFVYKWVAQLVTEIGPVKSAELA